MAPGEEGDLEAPGGEGIAMEVEGEVEATEAAVVAVAVVMVIETEVRNCMGERRVVPLSPRQLVDSLLCLLLLDIKQMQL